MTLDYGKPFYYLLYTIFIYMLYKISDLIYQVIYIIMLYKISDLIYQVSYITYKISDILY